MTRAPIVPGVDAVRRRPVRPGQLIDEFGLRAGPVVWRYRDAVLSATTGLGAAVDHRVGLGRTASGGPDLLPT